jgi:1-acyl-sn-glycerol-3-phosphate acyltransferase
VKAHAARTGAYVAPKVTASREVTHDGTATPWFYSMLRGVAALLFPLLFKLRVEGAEHVPASGAVMLASNHAAWIDIPLLSFNVPRITHYMAKVELFAMPGIGTLVRLLGAFPVRRGEGDRESLKTAVRLLKEGQIVNIFPEGHRSHGELIRGLPGVALIALMAGAPVVPVAIINSLRRAVRGSHIRRALHQRRRGARRRGDHAAHRRAAAARVSWRLHRGRRRARSGAGDSCRALAHRLKRSRAGHLAPKVAPASCPVSRNSGNTLMTGQ